MRKSVTALVAAIMLSANTFAQEYTPITKDDPTYIYLDRITAKEEKNLLKMDIGYEYTLTNRSAVYTQMMLEMRLKQWVDFYAGFHVATDDLYQFAVRGDFKYHFGPTRYLGLRNQYVYSLYAGDNLQKMNMALAAVYDQEYFSIAVGAYTQFFSPIVMGNGAARTFIWEVSPVYDINARIFKKAHRWNLGVQITNMRDFALERMYNPNFIINGNYRFAGEGIDNLNLLWKIGAQPTGIMHIAANNYSLYLQLGIVCTL